MDVRPFLTARWSHVLLLSYEAPEELLRPLVPPPLELDRREGRPHVSLVALRMDAIRIRGWRVPVFGAHAQVNFRTYVHHNGRPGVWFLRQLVPSRLVAAVGRLRYGEPFRAVPIESWVRDSEREVAVEYRVAGRWRAAATASRRAGVPDAGSADGYFLDRYLGYRTDRRGRLTVFRVAHPSWEARELRSLHCDADFGALYGAAWGVLNDRRPVSAVYAVGSDVSVFPPRPVTDSTNR